VSRLLLGYDISFLFFLVATFLCIFFYWSFRLWFSLKRISPCQSALLFIRVCLLLSVHPSMSALQWYDFQRFWRSNAISASARITFSRNCIRRLSLLMERMDFTYVLRCLWIANIISTYEFALVNRSNRVSGSVQLIGIFSWLIESFTWKLERSKCRWRTKTLWL